MPQYWTRISSSDPLKRLDDVRKACKKHSATLVGDQIYYDHQDQPWALVSSPNERYDWKPLLDDPDFGAQDWHGRVDANEKKNGKGPPGDGHKSQRP